MKDWKNDELLRTYDVLERIGEGGGGVVYTAYHRRLQKMVVLKKIIDPDYSADRNRQEVDILKNINHSYLPHVLDFLETSEGVFTVMDFIPGKTLQHYLKEGVQMAKEDLLKWAMQICSALHYLHTRRIPIIHGDIKPSNIMLKPDGDICLIDFNISFYFNNNTVLGCTRGYSSPEQILAVAGRRKNQDARLMIDPRTDIYSVGATLYHLATGRIRKDSGAPADVRQLAGSVGWPFAQVIARAVEPDPANRFQSAYDMYQALKVVPQQSSRRLQQKQKRNRRPILAAACVIALLCAGAAGILAMQKHKVAEYDRQIEEAEALVEAGDYEEAREASQKAIDLIGDEAEGYYWKDLTYYEEGDFQDCSRQLERDIGKVDQKTLSADSQKSLLDLYCLQGRAYLEQEGRSEEAAAAFAEAEDFSGNQMDAASFRDYAVALARDGQTETARGKIKNARKAAREGRGNLPEYAISYTEGEILMQDGRRSDALDCFQDAAGQMRGGSLSRDDQYLQYRTYMAMYDVYRDWKDWDGCADAMEEALGELEDSTWEISVRRKLAAAYSKQKRYGAAAEQYRLTAMADSGRWNDWRDAAICCFHDRNIRGMFSLAEDYRNRYGEDTFRYWFLMAYAERCSQDMRPSGQADYDTFREYYSYAGQTRTSRDQSDWEELTGLYNEVNRY
ncbi:MAG: protein kinase [Firmicutes bacterium]|nr:protein kinase [Bacillota bacterium]